MSEGFEPAKVRSETDAEIDRALLEVLKRSAVDDDFRRLALSDSRAAIKTINSTLPLEGIEVRFHEGATTTTRSVILNVGLPDAVSTTEELTDAEMEQVAGGLSSLWCICTACCTTYVPR